MLVSLVLLASSLSCVDDVSCSLNGVCATSCNLCECDVGWKGELCEYMDLAPTPAGSDLATSSSTWGGSIVHVNHSWHMYASEMLGGCGLTAWQSNSQVIHAVAPTPFGPWEREGVTLHTWAHCPSAAVSPDGVIILPRLWCSPIKYPAGVPGSCKAGVRTCLADGQCCRNGASPCGFILHEGQSTTCNSTKPPPSITHPASMRDDAARWKEPSDTMLVGPDQTSFGAFPASATPDGEFTANFTYLIHGWGGFSPSKVSTWVHRTRTSRTVRVVTVVFSL